MSDKWQKENDVDDYVKGVFASLRLVKNKDYYEKNRLALYARGIKRRKQNS